MTQLADVFRASSDIDLTLLFHLISYKNPGFSCRTPGFPFATNFQHIDIFYKM